MREDERLFRIESASKIIDDHVIDVILDMLGGITVSDDLVISDDHARRNTLVLKVDAFFDRAEIVTEVQTPCRSIAREHDVLRRMLEQVLFQCIALLDACLKTINAHVELFPNRSVNLQPIKYISVRCTQRFLLDGEQR